jgi:hypothetical protein
MPLSERAFPMQKNHTLRLRMRLGQGQGLGRMAFAVVCSLGAALAAQTLSSPAPGLPLRNLQIEVRQVQSNASDSTSAGASGTVRIGSNGQTGVNGQIQIQQNSQTRSGNNTQFALVLNGRSTRIALGATVPLRVYQTYVRNGQRVLAEGNVLLEANTGFNATPRWSGADTVELEIGAQQAMAASPQVGGLNPTSSVTSVVVVPLGEWSTIAQSEQSGNTTDRGLLGGASSANQSAVEVQVRVTVR